MQKAFIHRFFKELEREFGKPAEVILTGAAAGSLLGVNRPSMDIDFEIRVGRGRRELDQTPVRIAIQKIVDRLGVAANYSDDIGHWSMINLLDYRKKAFSYLKMGKLHIRLMKPEYWTIGKMGRFLEIDLRDVIRMIRGKKLKPGSLIPLWGRALRASPLSPDLDNFRRNVTHFIERYGKRAWGKKFDAKESVLLFEKSAGIVRNF